MTSCMQGLPNEQYRFVRRTIIGIVLATDMVDHSRLTKVAATCHGTAFFFLAQHHDTLLELGRGCLRNPQEFGGCNTKPVEARVHRVML